MKIDGIYKEEKYRLFESDENGREINIYTLTDTIPTGESLHYPNILLSKFHTTPTLINPLDEKIMSLEKVDEVIEFESDGLFDLSEIDYVESIPVFFFIYNTDNYFHFIYDTLPYLISYFKLKEDNPKLKLLMNWPNSGKNSHYKFVTELLSILGISEDDIVIVDEHTIYSKMYISGSYTHGIDSNLPPRNELSILYRGIVDKVRNDDVHPKKVYISRRSWVHGDTSNMGTNYTTRRKLVNEDELVLMLENDGYVEIFTETMSMVDKINLFSNADKIIGPIGGGLVNSLFSKEGCELISIMSPGFLNINQRFIFSINNVNLTLFEDVEHTEKTYLKSYMRVSVDGIVGEVTEVNGDSAKVTYSDVSVAGWNNDIEFKTKSVRVDECIKLDDGLNSPWSMNLDKFKEECL